MVSHAGSIGPKSSTYLSCLILTGPLVPSSRPWRAIRVGLHESIVSMPYGTTASHDSGSAMPSRWLGLSSGTIGIRKARSSSISARSLPSDPPMAKPSKGSDARYSADSRRIAWSVPPCTTPYMACWRGCSRCARSERAIQRCERRTDACSRSGVMWYGGSSSRGMMMSAPSCFCAATDDSGVSSMVRPSWYERKTAPRSETRSSEPPEPTDDEPPPSLASLASLTARLLRDFSSGPSSAVGCASEKTWKPPESVMRGPSWFM
mmetsp:Transcript_16394/g.44602  ORF Transcript_16394/g.44602 Transcript_16394/m.44602 type:complete len:263 (+) Transcript_16394:650-1438(+)